MLYRLVPILAVTLALLAGCHGHNPAEKPYNDDSVVWGPEVNGLQVGLAKRTYELGQEPGVGQQYFTIRLKNNTKRAMPILAPMAIGGVLPEKRAGNESVVVKLVYTTGNGVKTSEFTPAAKPVVYPLEPNREYVLQLQLAPSKFGMRQFVPGTLMAIYANAQESIRYDFGEAVSGLWTGEAKSGEVDVDVAPKAAEGEEQNNPAAGQAK